VVWFSEADLRALAGTRSYERGTKYLDAIATIDEVPGGVVATVNGTDRYTVRLRNRNGRLSGECSCPYGQEGAFCKHCVAVALSLLADTDGRAADPDARTQARGHRASLELRTFLASLDKAELVDLLHDHAQDDPVLHRTLSLRAASNEGAPDAALLKRLVDSLRIRGFVDYNGAFDYANKANDVLDTLAELLPRHAATVGPLIRRALERITKALEQIDDSSGWVSEAAARAGDLYAAACEAAPPNPVKLARWLVDWRLDETGWPSVDLCTFREALGERGMGAYRTYLSQLRDARSDDRDPSEHRWSAITRLREELARADGDVDGLVAIYAEDLSMSYQYLRIGGVLREAGRRAEAIDWVERGIRDATRTDGRLDDLLAELYQETGRHADALDVRKRAFAAQPELSTYGPLRTAAQHVDAWPATREWAIEVLRSTAAHGGYLADRLIRVLLDEDDVDAAWAVAGEFGCSPIVRLQLADRRAHTHPADAIPVYIAAVDNLIDRTNANAYREAITLLATLKMLHERAGRRFTDYLDPLKEVHRRKTRFLTELSRARL
jgi:uncharacterized Zn finger protein